MITARTKSVDDTQALAAELAAFARPGDVIVLAGDLGTGKTAFVQGFATAAGVTEPVTSPTFVLMRSYQGRLPIVHIDVYRLEHLQEAVDLGLAEVLDDGAVALIEWGDMVTPVLAADFLEVRLDRAEGDDERVIGLRNVGPTWAPRMTAVARSLSRWTVDTPC
jgi:tRNA threonylcarbamoyladenosine biosynthesis protein TsaE